jgi:transcriptional regulator with XRE-family HTH domain
MTKRRYNIEIKALGVNVKKFRKERGLTQIDLESMTGITQNAISRIENGMLDIQFSRIVTIAEALQVATRDLLDGENPENVEK